MINHSPKILSSELINILVAEEERIKKENNVTGSLEVDRVLPTSLDLLFDGRYLGGRYYRLLGSYNLENKFFIWE